MFQKPSRYESNMEQMQHNLYFFPWIQDFMQFKHCSLDPVILRSGESSGVFASVELLTALETVLLSSYSFLNSVTRHMTAVLTFLFFFQDS